jgi:radical SAM superfamily enzyme YgiQ (UPF0313 family)
MDVRPKSVPLQGRAAIVLPPGGQFAYPTLAPASLAGYLRAAGAEVELLDLNILGFHDVASMEGIEKLFARLQSVAAPLKLTLADRPDLLHLIDLLLGMTSDARRQLCGLVDRLRDLAVFRHETAYTVTLHHVGLLTRLVELAYHPVQFLPGSLIGGMFGRVRDLETLLNIETPYDDSVGRHLDATEWGGHDVIGLSAFTFDQLVYSLRLAPVLRERAPRAVLAVGGNCLTESEIPPSLMSLLADRFDVVVKGDGELPLLRTLEYALGLGTIEEIPNAYYTRDGRLVRNELLYKYRFERETSPDFGGLPMDHYLIPHPVLPFRFSNGCGYGRCTFCSESADRGPISSKLVYREVPGVQLVHHLEELRNRWGAAIFVNCSSLLSAQGAAEIGDAIAQHALPVQWFAMVRAERDWTPQAIAKAVAGGASTLNFGIESFNGRINRLMKKGINLERAPAIMRTFRERGVTVTCYTMANFPTESLAEFEQHLGELAEHFADSYDIIFKSNFMLVTEAPVYEQLIKLGVEVETLQLERMRAQPFPIYLLPDERTGDPICRMPGDRLEEKLDRYYALLLRLVMTEPLYFDRDFEIVSRTFYWEPEYNMIIREVGGKRFLPSYSLGELLAAGVYLADGVSLQRLDANIVGVTIPDRAIAFYCDRCTGACLERLRDGWSFYDAFRWVVAQLDPSARELLGLYEQVHRELRQAGVLRVWGPRQRSEPLLPASVTEFCRPC